MRALTRVDAPREQLLWLYQDAEKQEREKEVAGEL